MLLPGDATAPEQLQEENKKMGHQLGVSPVTGYRRKGTRFSALREIFVEKITARSIYEPLFCCPADSQTKDVRRALTLRGFDVAGVKDTLTNEVIGYVLIDELGDGGLRQSMRSITADLLVSDSTPIAEIFSVLTGREFAFVLSGQRIAGIITRADINKPPVRIYLFGMTSLFEMHLNAWVHHFYDDEGWVEKVPEQRMQAATRIYDLKKEKISNSPCWSVCSSVTNETCWQNPIRSELNLLFRKKVLIPSARGWKKSGTSWRTASIPSLQI